MNKIDHALRLAHLGFRIFPLAPGSKKPPKGFHWKEEATTDAGRIRQWWESEPNYNVGVATGAGTIVIDADTKDGKPGLESLEALEIGYNLPRSFRVKTPSGGEHVYLNAEGQHANRVDSIPDFPGIDIRSDGGYVVGPGSTIGGKTYIGGTGPVEPAGEALTRLLQQSAPTHQISNTKDPLVELDLPHHVEQAIEYLVNRAPEAVEGNGGDNTTFTVAARCREYGLSPDATLELMLEHWNEAKASPPWQPDDLKAKVVNAYNHATGAWGGATAAGQFDVADDIEIGESPIRRLREAALVERKANASRWTFEKVSDLRNLPPIKWLVKDWLPECATGIVYGKWGSGKTFLLFDLALHLAYGLEYWHGAALPDGPRKVLVLAREGHQGFTGRIDAFKRMHRIDRDTDMMDFMRAPISFMKTDEFKDFVAALKARQAGYSLIIIDTVARVLPGADISTFESVSTFMDRCDLLSKATGATTIGVHHQNKGGTMFGSVFFEANADFVFEVNKIGDNQALREGSIRCTKQKDGEDGWQKFVRYEQVPIGDELEAGSSLAIAEITSSAGASQLGDALEVIRKACEDGGAGLSANPRSRSHGRYAAEKIAKELRIDEKAAAGLVQQLLRQQHIEERKDSKTKRSYLAPAFSAAAYEGENVGGDAAETGV